MRRPPFAALLLLCLAAIAAPARGCVVYEDYMHWIGGYDSPGYAWDISLEGDIAYLADFDFGLCAISVSPGGDMPLLDHIYTGGEARSVDCAGSLVCVADAQSGLVLVDASDPSALELILTLGGFGELWSVCLDGSFAYLADSDQGLKIVDVSDPATAHVVATALTALTQRLRIRTRAPVPATRST